MLSQTAEYAVRAALYLARAEEDGRPVPADAIAAALGAPTNYLSKTLNLLAKAGLVEGVRGPAGGFRLAVPAAELTIARIVATFDGPKLRPVCLLGDRPCDSRAPCAAHHRWTAMTAAMEAPLSGTTLAELLGEAEPVRRRA
jgi:Rrf2 family protein